MKHIEKDERPTRIWCEITKEAYRALCLDPISNVRIYKGEHADLHIMQAHNCLLQMVENINIPRQYYIADINS